MKRILIAAFLTIVISLAAKSQLVFSDLSFDAACQQARKENKIVVLVVESSSCKPCNLVTMQALSGWQAKKAFSSGCILVKTNNPPLQLVNPSGLYTLSRNSYGVFFFDGDQNILNAIANRSSTLSDLYSEAMAKALKEKESAGPSFLSLKKEYYSGNNNMGTFRLLIEYIKRMGLEPSQSLLDDLVSKAPNDSAGSISFLQYIMRSAPLIGSAAQKYIEKNRDIYNMAWYRMDYPERVAINNRIVAKSEEKAIAEKDQSYAYRVASFVQTINNSSSNQENLQRLYQHSLLQYYKGVKDTGNYLRMAVTHYDQFYMQARVDDIKMSDSAARVKRLTNTAPQPVNPDMPNIRSLVVSNAQLYPRAFYFSNALNEGAWYVYLFSKNPLHLSKALSWAKRANEFMESPEIMDTYARLLYKTGNQAEAIDWETKADKLARARIATMVEYRNVLEKMKAGSILIDPEN